MPVSHLVHCYFVYIVPLIHVTGYGSNLTYEGDVECDASLMTSSSHFGAVGAISGNHDRFRKLQIRRLIVTVY